MVIMEKRENFKFSMRTIQNIQALIDMGLARNKTEAIDLALEHMVTEETTKRLYRTTYAQTGIIEAPGGNEALGMGGAWEFLKPPGENIQLL